MGRSTIKSRKRNDCISKFTKNCIRFACLLLVGYMTTLQVHRYFENKDVSSVSMKEYNSVPQNTYPTFTICWWRDAIYDKDYLMENHGITSTKFQKILRGSEVTGLNETLKEVLAINYDDAVLKIKTTLNSAGTLHANNSIVNEWDGQNNGRNGSSDLPLYISWKDPDKICFTRKTDFDAKLIRTYDWVHFDMTKKFNLKTHSVHIHHPYQFSRHMDKRLYRMSMSKNSRKLHKFDISGVMLLRRRPDGAMQCNPNLDDDVQFRKSIVNNVGCVPSYWESLIISREQNITGCNSTSQLKEIYKQISYPKSVMASYNPPCNKMSLSYTFTRMNAKPGLKLKFMYTSDDFVEIINQKDFGFEMFWSSVGGFIGMFLGCSLWQAADSVLHIGKLMSVWMGEIQ